MQSGAVLRITMQIGRRKSGALFLNRTLGIFYSGRRIVEKNAKTQLHFVIFAGFTLTSENTAAINTV